MADYAPLIRLTLVAPIAAAGSLISWSPEPSGARTSMLSNAAVKISRGKVALGMDVARHLDAAGLVAPFIYGSFAYRLFQWLDKNASDNANRALSSWLKGQPYQQLDMVAAILGVFDLIYTYPLLRPRAIFRSIFISIICFISFMFYIMRFNVNEFLPTFSTALPLLLSLCVSDYVSLFTIRYFLRRTKHRLLSSLSLAFLYGIFYASILYKVGESLLVRGVNLFTRISIIMLMIDLSMLDKPNQDLVVQNDKYFDTSPLGLCLATIVRTGCILGKGTLRIFRSYQLGSMVFEGRGSASAPRYWYCCGGLCLCRSCNPGTGFPLLMIGSTLRRATEGFSQPLALPSRIARSTGVSGIRITGTV